MSGLKTVSPVDGRVVVERALHTRTDVERTLQEAQRAQREWAHTPLATRVQIVERAVTHFVSHGAAIAEEITWQMGRPLAHSPGEVRGFEERARAMLELAATALAPIEPAPKPGLRRRIERVPLGVVAVVAPWCDFPPPTLPTWAPSTPAPVANNYSPSKPPSPTRRASGVAGRR